MGTCETCKHWDTRASWLKGVMGECMNIDARIRIYVPDPVKGDYEEATVFQMKTPHNYGCTQHEVKE